MKIFLAGFILIATSWVAAAAPTFNKATITYLQNDVTVADVKLINTAGAQAQKTAASLNQTVTRDNAVVTGDKSRVEMKFNDGSVVRLGQFTVFSFKEGTRDINLKQGSALMNVPKGMGQTNIKAAAVTAAITGTTVLFQAFQNYAAVFVYEGTVTIPPNFILGPGDVLIFEDGKFRVEKFDIRDGVKTAALFTRFVESPNNGPFTINEILEAIANQLNLPVPDGFDDTQKIDAIINRIIKEELEKNSMEPELPNYGCD